MPMQSQAQRAYLHIHHPKLAEKFEAETPKGKKLPKHKKKRKKDKDGHGSLAAALLAKKKGE